MEWILYTIAGLSGILILLQALLLRWNPFFTNPTLNEELSFATDWLKKHGIDIREIRRQNYRNYIIAPRALVDSQRGRISKQLWKVLLTKTREEYRYEIGVKDNLARLGRINPTVLDIYLYFEIEDVDIEQGYDKYDVSTFGNLEAFENCRRLKQLSLVGVPIADLKPLEKLSLLRSLTLDLSHAQPVSNLNVLNKLDKVEILKIYFKSIDFNVLHCATVRHLFLIAEQPVNLREIKRAFPNLVSLRLDCRNQKSIDGMEEFSSLVLLSLKNTGVTEFRTLEKLTKLKALFVREELSKPGMPVLALPARIQIVSGEPDFAGSFIRYYKKKEIYLNKVDTIVDFELRKVGLNLHY